MADTDSLSAGAFFRGKRVLITGAAGSIGASLAIRLSSLGCTNLTLLDHYDHGLIETAEQVSALAPSLDVVEALCNIREVDRVHAWIERSAPDIVIHAAALKHVQVGEKHPCECILTNLIGVKNVVAASAAAGVGQFLLISSDKAASPVCVMGATKRLAELYLAGFEMERSYPIKLRAVRFGNVFGSRGSVAPRFQAQIAAGGPIEITHPQMERYFMSMDDAVDLILSVAAIDDGRQSKIYFKDMGEMVSIMDLGRQMIEESGRDIAIKITGLRPGEKLKEELFDRFERVVEAGLSEIYRVTPISTQAYVTTSDIAQLEMLARSGEDALMRQRLFGHLDARLGRSEAKAG